MRMRFRLDGWHYADLKAAGKTAEEYFHPELATEQERKYWNETPPAERGDVWRIFWAHDVDGQHIQDWIAGYAICCVACCRIHNWTTALNCGQKHKRSLVGTDGKTYEYESCTHSENHSSCWTWSGSAEDGTLTATPSLLVVKGRCEWGCSWHGWIIDGDIHG